MESVNIIPVQYFWECPECGYQNHIEGVISIVKCYDCEKEYFSNPLHFWKEENENEN